MKNKAFLTRSLKSPVWFALLLILPMLAQAEIIQVTTPSNESYIKVAPQFDSNYEYDSWINQYTVANAIDFTTLGDTLLTQIIQAPTGMRFHASFAEDGYFSVRNEFGSSGSVAGDFLSHAANLKFGGFGGTPITASDSSVYITGPSSGIFHTDSSYTDINFNVSAGSDFWFENLTVQILIPASFNTNLPSAKGVSQVSGTISTTTNTDYGQFVRLESVPSSSSVPEPAAWLLILLGGVILRTMRRH